MHSATMRTCSGSSGRSQPSGRPEIDAHGGAQHGARRFRFGDAFLRRAVGAHFAARQVAEADAAAFRGVACDGPGHADFEIVGMRAKYEQIERRVGHHPRGLTADTFP